jgi:GMP synthase-like glutamine amidotransferase
MRILALIHEEPPCSGVFAEVAAERGSEIEEWSVAWDTPPPRPVDEYDAAMLFGGTMHVDQERYHPWLREENLLIQRFLDQHVPVLGVCLGGQLIAKAAHANVGKAPQPEIGWFPTELTPQAADDPVFGRLPGRFFSYQWHHYRFALPAGAVSLATTPVCLQAFRLGELAWGLQFHCEVTRTMVLSWTDAYDAMPDADRTGFDPDLMRADTDVHIAQWNEIGREICDRFLEVAERAAAAPARYSRA